MREAVVVKAGFLLHKRQTRFGTEVCKVCLMNQSSVFLLTRMEGNLERTSDSSSRI